MLERLTAKEAAQFYGLLLIRLMQRHQIGELVVSSEELIGSDEPVSLVLHRANDTIRVTFAEGGVPAC